MWHEFFAYGFINTLPAGAGLIFTPNAPPVRIDSRSDFKWMKSLYGATNGNIRMRFRDSRLGRELTTVGVIIRSVASNFAGTPYILSSPYYIISAGSNYIIDASDASGFANVLRFVMHGARLKSGIAPWEESQGRWKAYRRMEPYTYNSGLRVLPIGGTDQFSITIENDAPFLIQKLTGEHNGAVGAVLLDIRDSTSSEETWSNIQVPFETMFGTGQFPNILYAYRMVGGANSPATLTINTQNLTAFAINYEVAFSGLKLFM